MAFLGTLIIKMVEKSQENISNQLLSNALGYIPGSRITESWGKPMFNVM